MIRTSATRSLASLALAVTIGAGALTSCSGGGDSTSSATPSEVLLTARHKLDSTSGVHLVLNTDTLPDGVSGVVNADGIGVHPPAFEGSIKVFFNGINADVPVISVNGAVFAKLPFTTKYTKINPADYGAPDPATLLDPQNGISRWLTDVRSPTKGKQVREGDKVLTSYSGTLPGKSVDAAIPAADETKPFDVVFSIADDGTLQNARLTGVFYKGKPSMTYTVSFDQYGTKKTITAP